MTVVWKRLYDRSTRGEDRALHAVDLPIAPDVIPALCGRMGPQHLTRQLELRDPEPGTGYDACAICIEALARRGQDEVGRWSLVAATSPGLSSRPAVFWPVTEGENVA